MFYKNMKENDMHAISVSINLLIKLLWNNTSDLSMREQSIIVQNVNIKH